MKKIICTLFAVLLSVAVVLPVSAEMSTVSYVQTVHIEPGETLDTQTAVYYDSLEKAVKNAKSGDVIEVFDDVKVSSPISVPADTELTFVSGTKRKYTAIFGRSIFEYTDPNAEKRTVKKNFDGSLFTLGENSRVTFENIVLDGDGKGGTKGGLIYVESGAVLTVKSSVTLKNSKLGEGSFGGAIYAEKGSTLTLEHPEFSGNQASNGADIYSEQEGDVTDPPELIDTSALYSDVKETSWFKGAVDYAVTYGLMNGVSEDKFNPNGTMTRAMLVTVLWRLENSPAVGAEVPFADLKQDWYKTAVAWAYENEIVNGTSADKFSPNGAITREQMAAILFRYSDYKKYDVTSRGEIDTFPDAGDVHSYATDAISWTVGKGLIGGVAKDGNTYLDPRGSATRAQVATILQRFCESVKG